MIPQHQHPTMGHFKADLTNTAFGGCTEAGRATRDLLIEASRAMSNPYPDHPLSYPVRELRAEQKRADQRADVIFALVVIAGVFGAAAIELLRGALK